MIAYRKAGNGHEKENKIDVFCWVLKEPIK